VKNRSRLGKKVGYCQEKKKEKRNFLRARGWEATETKVGESQWRSLVGVRMKQKGGEDFFRTKSSETKKKKKDGGARDPLRGPRAKNGWGEKKEKGPHMGVEIIAG